MKKNLVKKGFVIKNLKVSLQSYQLSKPSTADQLSMTVLSDREFNFTEMHKYGNF